MADLENAKMVDEEKPLLAPAPDEQLKSGTPRRMVSNIDKFMRVVLVMLLILNFAQWLSSVKSQDATKTDECLQKEKAILEYQAQLGGLCLDRIALKSVKAENELTSLPNDAAQEPLLALGDLLSTNTIESKAVAVAFKKVEKVLAVQNKLLRERAIALQAASHPQPQYQDLDRSSGFPLFLLFWRQDVFKDLLCSSIEELLLSVTFAEGTS